MENYEKAEQDYMAGMKYKDIAEKYKTTINTVKSWKKRYEWRREKCAHKDEKVCTQKHKGAPNAEKHIDDGTKATLQNDDLTPEQQMFCIYYSKTFNATQSYINAYGCQYSTALTNGPALLGNTRIKKEIERLKEIKRQQIIAGADDIVELQMRIAFGDIGDALEFTQEERELPDGNSTMVNVLRAKDSSMVDTQLIKSVTEGRIGLTVVMKDEQKAIDWLTKYFEINPADRHRREFEKRKLDLELLKLESQTKEDTTADATEQDNFLDALNGSAGEVWQDD